MILPITSRLNEQLKVFLALIGSKHVEVKASLSEEFMCIDESSNFCRRDRNRESPLLHVHWNHLRLGQDGSGSTASTVFSGEAFSTILSRFSVPGYKSVPAVPI